MNRGLWRRVDELERRDAAAQRGHAALLVPEVDPARLDPPADGWVATDIDVVSVEGLLAKVRISQRVARDRCDVGDVLQAGVVTGHLAGVDDTRAVLVRWTCAAGARPLPVNRLRGFSAAFVDAVVERLGL